MSELLPHPLHPGVVHIPLGLALVLPILVILVQWSIRRQWIPQRAWCGIVLLQGMLFAAVIVAVETGEDEEGVALNVVPKSAIETHSDRAAWFRVFAAVATGCAALGLVSGRLGAVARWVTMALSLVLCTTAALVGKSGGDVAYRHGAATMYRSGPAQPESK